MAARIGLALATAGTFVALAVVPASAATGGPMYSGDQVGFAATGRKFVGSEIDIKLPNAAKFAREVGRVGISVQLWSKNTVVAFTAFACTDQACRPGGAPKTFKYRLDISVYNRTTGALRCSTTAATAARRCANAFPSWNRARIASGTNEILDLQYNRSQGLMLASANALNAAVSVSVGPIIQARIAVQFGPTPFSIAPFHAPRAQQLAFTVGGFSSEFLLPGDRGVYIGSPLVVRHRIDMTSTGRRGQAEAEPSAPFNDGALFHVYFQ